MAGAEAGCSSDDECLEELMGGAPSHSRPRSSARQAAKKRPKHEPDSDSDLGTGLERAEQTDLAAALGVKGDMAACEAAADAAAPSKYVAWSKQEDANLRRLVEKMGAKNWSSIAAHMYGRTSKSCRLRWLNQLRPNVQTGGFTPDEDEIIVAQQRSIGNRWTQIAAMLPGRTDNAVKNRWNSALRKRVESVHVHQSPSMLPSQTAKADHAQQQPQLHHQMHMQQFQQQQQQQQSHEDLQDVQNQQQQVVQQLLSSAAAARKGSSGTPPPAPGHEALLAAAAAAAQSGIKLPTSIQQLLAKSLAANHGTSANSNNTYLSSSLLPAPPPNSTPMVGTSPPFQLPMPAMTLQPQMSPTEAAAALAAARCDMFKKVDDSSYGAYLDPPASCAMVGMAPPPVSLSSGALSPSGLSASQLATSLLQHAPVGVPVTSALVAATPPPVAMPIRADPPPKASSQSLVSASSAGSGQLPRADSGMPSSDLAQLLLMQHQQLQQQAALVARLSQHLQSSSTGQGPQPASEPEQAPQAAASLEPGSGSLVASLEAAARSGGSSMARALHAAMATPGGAEVLQHLLTLGIGTLMTASQLRSSAAGGGSQTLLRAQSQMGNHPSVQALLPLLSVPSGAADRRRGSSDGGHMHVDGIPDIHHPHLGAHQAHQGHTRRGSGGNMIKADVHGSPVACPFGIASPFGSMSDLLGLMDSTKHDNGHMDAHPHGGGGGAGSTLGGMRHAGSTACLATGSPMAHGMTHAQAHAVSGLLGSTGHLMGLLDDDMM